MNLRRSAAQVLVSVIRDGHSLTAALEQNLSGIANPKDRALIQAICYGVIRHYEELDFLLKQLVSKPLKAKDADIEALLLAGLYQLQYMRVKSHAAVSETVAASQHKPWAKSLVNAVLRQYLRDADNLKQRCQQHYQSHYNHPDWLAAQLREQWPQQADAILTANNQPPPMTLRVNLQQTSREHYTDLLLAQGLACQDTEFSATGITLQQPVSVDELPGFKDGLVSVQDQAAQLAASLLEPQVGDRILDLCAAPGGKTAAILELQPALAGLLAVDIDAGRLQRVQDTLTRLQLSADTRVADATQATVWGQELRFNRILLDAPCSGLGVIRRHPDIKLLRRSSDISALQSLQSQILDAAWHLLETGGMLLYATCSVLKQENEQQIAAFLQRHNDAQEITIDASWGMQRPHGRQIISGQDQMDGFYYAKLRKTG